jgi:class 3 adenylate cyclase
MGQRAASQSTSNILHHARMTATRRLAAILAVDIVGYSRLMGEDAMGTAQAPIR